MRITRSTRQLYHPYNVIVEVILDTDRIKEKARNLWENGLDDFNDCIDKKIDKTTGQIIDFLG